MRKHGVPYETVSGLGKLSADAEFGTDNGPCCIACHHKDVESRLWVYWQRDNSNFAGFDGYKAEAVARCVTCGTEVWFALRDRVSHVKEMTEAHKIITQEVFNG